MAVYASRQREPNGALWPSTDCLNLFFHESIAIHIMDSTRREIIKDLRDKALRFEWVIMPFWLYILVQVGFPGRSWVVSSNQPVVASGANLANMIVEHYDVATPGLFKLLIVMNAKPGRATSDQPNGVESSEPSAAEETARRTCIEHLVHTGRNQIWAMTCSVSMGKLWATTSHRCSQITTFKLTDQSMSTSVMPRKASPKLVAQSAIVPSLH